MGRLPLGSVSPYVKTSSGGSIDPMKFYCTSYGEAYGQEGFHPRNGFHVGAGYKSNYRPVVQYNSNLDKIDNPAVGKLLQDNYESTTNKYFQPLQLPDGKYPLPWSVHQPGSGYVREKPLTFPTTKTGSLHCKCGSMLKDNVCALTGGILNLWKIELLSAWSQDLVHSTAMQGEDCGSKIAKFIRSDLDINWDAMKTEMFTRKEIYLLTYLSSQELSAQNALPNKAWLAGSAAFPFPSSHYVLALLRGQLGLILQVKRVHFDTANQGAEAVIGLEPRHVPVLHNTFGKGSVEAENARHGPQFMSTEYGSKYRFNIPGQPDFLQKKTIGAKEESGFTEGCLANPIVEKLASQDSNPGISIMKADYLPSSVPHGDEFLPVLSKGSERGSGFSRQKDLRIGSSGPLPNAEASGPLSHSQFQGHPLPPQTQTNLLGREYVGNKEPTGFSTNNLSYVTPAYDPNLPNRFLTSYNSKFYETMPKGLDREGWTRGGIQPQQAGGFATNNHGTDLGSDPNATETLRTVHPHVGRTITTVDPFYRDSPHDRRFAALHQTAVPN